MKSVLNSVMVKWTARFCGIVVQCHTIFERAEINSLCHYEGSTNKLFKQKNEALTTFHRYKGQGGGGGGGGVINFQSFIFKY